MTTWAVCPPDNKYLNEGVLTTGHTLIRILWNLSEDIFMANAMATIGPKSQTQNTSVFVLIQTQSGTHSFHNMWCIPSLSPFSKS